MRVYFSAWGSTVRGVKLPAYAVARGSEKAGAVAACIARALKLSVITLVSTVSSVDHGRITDHQYEMTVGRPCRGGGWTPTGRVWFSIPVSA